MGRSFVIKIDCHMTHTRASRDHGTPKLVLLTSAVTLKKKNLHLKTERERERGQSVSETESESKAAIFTDLRGEA